MTESRDQSVIFTCCCSCCRSNSTSSSRSNDFCCWRSSEEQEKAARDQVVPSCGSLEPSAADWSRIRVLISPFVSRSCSTLINQFATDQDWDVVPCLFNRQIKGHLKRLVFIHLAVFSLLFIDVAVFSLLFIDLAVFSLLFIDVAYIMHPYIDTK